MAHRWGSHIHEGEEEKFECTNKLQLLTLPFRNVCCNAMRPIQFSVDTLRLNHIIGPNRTKGFLC